MKLYTKRGDHGQTDLFGGQSTTKDNPRVHAYGQVDELNAFVGHAHVAASSHAAISEPLLTLQNHLFILGADLATPHNSAHADKTPRIDASHIQWAEKLIDEIWATLPPMKTFILPGGSELAARLHIARGVCRRAERDIVTLAKIEPLGDHLPIYLNRVSDLLFALARQANQYENVTDIPWISPS